MVVTPFLKAIRNSAPLVLGLTLGWNLKPVQAQAPDAGRQSGGVLLEFPNFGPIPGSTEPSLGPGPGAMEPGMLAPESGIIGGADGWGGSPGARATRSQLLRPWPSRLGCACPQRYLSTRRPHDRPRCPFRL